MPSYKFVQERGDLYCYGRQKKHLVVTISGIRFLLPMSVASDQRILANTKEARAKQVDLFTSALEEGTPIDEAVDLLAVSTVLNFEFSHDSVGDLLGLPKQKSDSE